MGATAPEGPSFPQLHLSALAPQAPASLGSTLQKA